MVCTENSTNVRAKLGHRTEYGIGRENFHAVLTELEATEKRPVDYSQGCDRWPGRPCSRYCGGSTS